MSFRNTRAAGILWHVLKSALCILQMLLLHGVSLASVNILLFQLTEAMSLPYALLHPCADLIVFPALWWYYDRIDDYSFNRYCERYRECDDPPHLLRDPGFIIEAILTLTAVTPMLASAIATALRFTPLSPALGIAVAMALATLFVGGASLLRIHRLSHTWSIQKNLRSQPSEQPSPIKYAVTRVLYAAIFLAALYFAVYYGITIFIPVLWPLVWAAVHLLRIPILVFLGFLVVWEIIRFIRHFLDRRKFLRRLERLRDKGELSFEIHGHPYRSLFGYRNHFGLTITDAPHPDGKKKTDTVYRVAVANCHRRRMTVILCENDIYQFMYSVNIRVMRSMRGGMGMMGMGGVHTNRSFSLPAASWFISHGFDFPEGEGERILLVDPVPYVLSLRGGNGSELYPLDNASKVFGYTVYGKNSFVNMLERT